MQSSSPISRHRRARLNAWMRLWLVWFVGQWATWWNGGARASPRVLDGVARMVGHLIVINAAARTPRAPRNFDRHGRVKRGNTRTVLGAAIRRALRGKDAPSRLFAILSVVRDMERHVAALVKRLPRGLTRLRVIVPQRESAPPPETVAGAVAPAFADTS